MSTADVAALVARALLAEAAGTARHRRLYLRAVHGVSPAEVFDALVPELGDAIVVTTDAGSVHLAAARQGSTLLVPYLVDESAPASGNAGLRGFAGTLRTDFSQASGDDVRVLLVLDEDPFETVLSASEDAAGLPELSWPRLLARLDAVASLPARSLVADVRAHLSHHAADLDQAQVLVDFARFASTPWASPGDAGRALHELGCYVGDSHPTTARLAHSWRWRHDLEAWSLPDRDLAAELLRTTGERTPGIDRVLSARTPLGLDYGRFTLDDLPERRQAGTARLADPAEIVGARAAMALGRLAAVLVDEDAASISIRLAGRLRSTAPTVLWGAQSQAATCVVDASALLATVLIPGRGDSGWHFGRLRFGSTTLDLAILRSNGPWMPVDESWTVDVAAGAFTPDASPRAIGIGEAGAALGSATVTWDGDDADSGTLLIATAALDGYGDVDYPVLVPGTDDGPDEEADPEREDGPDDGEEDDDDDDESSAGSVPTGPHALLFVARGRSGAGTAPTSVAFSAAPADRPFFTVGTGSTVRVDLESQRLVAGDARDLEEQILRRPEVLGFSIANGRLAPEPSLEPLDLVAVDPSEFLTAREAFFRAARDVGGVHAALCGDVRAEADAYIDAFSALLDEAARPGRYAAELDRLIACDVVVDAAEGQCWLAPTNPLTLAWGLDFADRACAWAMDGHAPPAAYVDSVTPAHLLPLMYIGGRWYESEGSAPLLWRSYRPLGGTLAPLAGNSRALVRRIRRFLDVFPQYQDPSQRLSIAVHSPASGSSLLQALRDLYYDELRPGADQVLPAIDLTCHTSDGRLPTALAGLSSPDSSNDLDRLVGSRVRVAALREDEPPRFSHLAVLYRPTAQREPQQARLDERAPSDWVAGLATGPARAAIHAANETTFIAGVFPGHSSPRLRNMITRTLELVGGQPRGFVHPGMTQAITTTVRRDASAEVYAQTVWTVHADRLLGLEAFAPESRVGMTIVDYESVAGGAGLDSITVTKRLEPYLLALRRAFEPFANLRESALDGIIEAGNAVSGRWNLDLLSIAPNRVRERVGMVAALAALRDLDKGFEPPAGGGSDLGGLVLPFDEMSVPLIAGGHPRPERRWSDDLVYARLGLDSDRARLVFRIVEVKYATTGQPDVSVARAQLLATRDWLVQAFANRDAGWPFRCRDLSEILRSAAIRNRSFGFAGVDPHRLELITAAVAAGRVDIRFDYRVGGQSQHGDVVSLEMESPVPFSRQQLPGEGDNVGYIRLGRPAFDRLNSGQRLIPPRAWERPDYEPPDDAQPTPPPRRPLPGPGSSTRTEPAAANESDITAPSGAAGTTTTEEGRAQTTRTEAVEHEVEAKARELDAATGKYGIELAPFSPELAQVGPSVIRFRTRLLGKQTIAAVRSRSLDIGREVGVAEGVFIDQEPYYLTIDVPRQEREVVRLADHIAAVAEPGLPGALPFLLGMAPSGEVVVEDLARLPHLLVAGATGSGKSVLLRGLLCCLVTARSPLELQLLIIDPKQVDFLPFRGLMHLVGDGVISDAAQAIEELQRVLDEQISRRRDILAADGATSAIEFYERGGRLDQLPQMVVLVDEFAELAASLDRKRREAFLSLIQRYGQLTRAFGIYLVLATQRPSVQVITGDIKANLTARVALKTQSGTDSMTILGRAGAEALRDRGDLIFDHGGRTQRLQGFYADLDDIGRAVGRWTTPATEE